MVIVTMVMVMVMLVYEEFSGWSDRLNAENVECYCFQLPGSGSRRQASVW